MILKEEIQCRHFVGLDHFSGKQVWRPLRKEGGTEYVHLKPAAKGVPSKHGSRVCLFPHVLSDKSSATKAAHS